MNSFFGNERKTAAKPTLSDCNNAAQIIVSQLKRAGAPAKRILGILENLYKPLGITVMDKNELDNIPQTYSASQIAWICGMFSLYGNPHASAVSCIINENLLIGSGHKFAVSENYIDGVANSFRYDDYALEEVKIWLESYKYPNSIYGISRTYHVIYRK